MTECSVTPRTMTLSMSQQIRQLSATSLVVTPTLTIRAVMNSRAPRRRRLGLTLIELLLVVVMAGIIFAIAIPRMTTLKTSTTLRAGRQQLTTAFAAARAAALQKGKTSTLTLTGSTARVSVMSGLNATSVNVFGPVRLDGDLGLTLSALSSAPTSVQFDSRGMLTPTPASTLKYRIAIGSVADTICISPAGVIMPKGCQL